MVPKVKLVMSISWQFFKLLSGKGQTISKENYGVLTILNNQDAQDSDFSFRQIKFIYSEKATKFWEISTIDLTETT